MADEANNTGQNANNDGNNNQQVPTNAPADDRSMDGVDPTISKHLDIAIEAQDGKKADATAADTGKETDESGKTDKPKDSESGSGDTTDKSGDKGKAKDPEISEAARKLAGAKDLKLADGSVVKGGAERRFFEQRETARQQLADEQKQHQTTRQQLQDLQTKYNAIESSTKSLHGVEPQVAVIGVNIVKDMQRDPIGTLKKLVAEAAAKGYNVEDLGVGVDTAAIQRMLDERLPKDGKTELTEEQIIDSANKEVAQFYVQYPDAKPHDALIARVLRDHPDMSLQSVYYEIKNGFAEKGLDWSLPLEQQLEALGANDPSKTDKGADDPNNRKAPLPNGGNEGEFKLTNDRIASDDMDTGDIVRQAMRESGLNI